MIGKRLAHYEILGVLGAGGMGEVYRARDGKLGRDVALKVLPAELAAEPERLERFKREARAVAALTHPNIVTVFSVEEADGTHFLTMELVEGRPLDRLIPDGGMPANELLEIAVALADAVAAAHERGIVHRDLKPTNIMLSSNRRVKVLDFGLAKLQPETAETDATSLPTEAGMTREGQVIGTVPYMSPEQVEGGAIDRRTDVFSLGVVLYEMATGRRPFSGQSSPALMASILKDAPPPVSELNRELPRHLGRIVSRCLEKGVTARYQTALDVYNELRSLQREILTSGRTEADSVASAGAPATGSRSSPAPPMAPVDSGDASVERSLDSFPSLAGALRVAVTPFSERSGDPDASSLAEGLSESIVTGLARFSYLSVVSPEASPASGERALDAGAPEAHAVGADLGARYVLGGSVRRAGSRIRVSARLIDSAAGAHLWAESYDRDLADGDLFALQDELAGRIVSTTSDLHGVLPRAMSAVVKAKPPEDLTPYEAVLRSFDYWRLLTPSEHLEVRACLERAVEQAPGYADALAALSMMYAEEHKHRFNPRPDPLGRALDAARRAVDADPANHIGFHALAQAQFFRKDFAPFRLAADRAIALNPWDGITVAFMGILMAYAGDWDHGTRVARDAARLNPHHPGWYRFAEVWNHYRLERYEEALAAAQRINMPTYFYSHVALAFTNARVGRLEAAREALAEALELVPDLGEVAGTELRKWLPDDLAESSLEGLRMAGLNVRE